MKNIFISSTFIDMQAERDLVQERVLPALRGKARKYGDDVGVIDLRWGVDTSTLETEEGAAKVLQVCLDEIDRSHPYMLIFLGERYGTMMRKDQIEKSVRGREDKYTTDDYVKSITALEVEYGALSEKYGELNYCVVCFREPVVHMLDGEEKDLYAEHTEEGKRKLEALKERIKRDLGDDERLITYSCTWDKSARQLVDFASNGQPLENVLTNCFVEMFRDDWKEYESLSWQDKEQLAFRSIMENKLRSFVGREALLEEYYQSVVNGICPIILQGEVGSGKTAIMCKLVERLQKEGKNVFAFFSGAGSMSTNAEFLVKQMVYYMENLLGIEEHFGEKNEEKEENNDVEEKLLQAGAKRVQYENWMKRLEALCSRFPAGEKVYFCIDAMDQLFPDEHVEKLDFFVRGKNVQVIASCTDEFVILPDVKGSREIKTIPVLSKADATEVERGILASYFREPYATIEAEILEKKSVGNPLYISLLIQRLNMMDTDELQNARTEEKIIARGTGIIKEMPEEPEEAIVAVIQTGIDKISESKELLYEILEYLAVSRNGLRMQDLQKIFTLQKKVLPTLDFTLLMKYLDSFFCIHEDDRIDFTHRVIRCGLLKNLTDRAVKEEVIKDYLKTLGDFDGLCKREGMYFARICKDESFARQLIEQAYVQEDEETMKSIKEEAVADQGEFFCGLIAQATGEESVVRDFFLWRMLEQFGTVKEEAKACAKIARKLILCLYEMRKKTNNQKARRDSIKGCNQLAKVYKFSKMPLEVIKCYMDNVGEIVAEITREEILEQRGEYVNLLVNMGDAYMQQGLLENALKAYELALKIEENREYLQTRLIIQDKVGKVYMEMGELMKAAKLFEYVRDERMKMLGKNYNVENLRWASDSLENQGHLLVKVGALDDALKIFEKVLEKREEVHAKIKNEWSLYVLKNAYRNKGDVLKKLGREKEAEECFEKAGDYYAVTYEDSENGDIMEENYEKVETTEE